MKKKLLSILFLVLLVLNSFGCNTKKEDIVKKYELSVSKEAVDLFNSKIIGLKSINNARTLGGFATSDGRKVKNNLLVRCGHLGILSDEDKKILIDNYNIKNIVDFRTSIEESKDEDKQIDGATYQRIDIINNDDMAKTVGENYREVTGDRAKDTLINYYFANGSKNNMYDGIVDSTIAKKGYKKFFDVLINSDGGTIFHCTSGKDRTGFASAFLLHVLGVDKKTILNDFEASNVYYKDSILKTCELLEDKKFSSQDIIEICHLLGVNRAAFEKILDKIDSIYGGMDAYIHNEIGLTDEEIAILRNKYLE